MRNRWYILALAALTFIFAVGIPWACLPVLFSEISKDLGLSLVQIGTVWATAGMAGIFVSLIGGLLFDRFGIKRTLAVGCFLAGLTGALRGLSGGFVSLMITSFLFGLLCGSIPSGVHKAAGMWFPGRQQALAQGIVCFGMAMGSTLGAMISATLLSPLLGGWRNVLFLYGAISIVIGVFWLTSPSVPKGSQVEASTGHGSTAPFRQTLSRIFHIKRVWLLGVVMAGQMGCTTAIRGYLPLYLRNIGWAASSADVAASAFTGAGMLAVIPLSLLSDKLGSRKAVLIAATLITTIALGLLSVSSGLMVWVLLILMGFVAIDAFMSVLMTTIIETDGVGPVYGGTAVGLVQTISRVGIIIAPPVGNSLAGINPGLPFVFWAGFAAVSLICTFFIRETAAVKVVTESIARPEHP